MVRMSEELCRESTLRKREICVFTEQPKGLSFANEEQAASPETACFFVVFCL